MQFFVQPTFRLDKTQNHGVCVCVWGGGSFEDYPLLQPPPPPPPPHAPTSFFAYSTAHLRSLPSALQPPPKNAPRFLHFRLR